MERRRAVIHGLVQGVWFRETTRTEAEANGVSGWIRNRPDGTVEAVFEGAPDAIERLLVFVRRGPRDAIVTHVDVTAEPAEGLAGFAVR